MLISSLVWDAIHAQFSEDEKVMLGQAISGHVIGPESVTIVPEMLSLALLVKLTAALDAAGGAS